MKLKAIRSFRHGTATYRRGLAVEVSEPIARDLLKRQLVEEEGTGAAEASPRAIKPAKAGNQRRDDKSATTGRAADRKED